ncbi:MAG TPA: hypothetical protein VFO85_08105, partial [Vicinamibacteria bacterium]|nr:hypothetical protein [Vicinamibacteria bacterium]
AVFGWERFTVRSQAGREMVMVMRTASALEAIVLRPGSGQAVGIDIALGAADLSIDGRPLGRVTIGARPGWDEVVLRVPAAAVTGAASRLELKGRYAAFRYWIYQ